MMSAGSSVSHTAENGTGGNKRTPCPFHGCKRVYSDVNALQTHINDHEISAQSLPGMACNRRILWEHTRGRYTCVQCGHSVTNRKEMTQHISSYHSGNKPAEDAGSSATNT
ncbi:zinc finger protein 414 [Morone saxatilis]|uniref:zinc finger protein 414 n=1 Tax=Morone saxatilis TaxID=34816 RepID=UPI0015E21EBC|nr:zinc finger protein 414 [Morone saxatilis]